MLPKHRRRWNSCWVPVVALILMSRPCPAQQVNVKARGRSVQLIQNVLGNAHLSGSLAYSDMCERRGLGNASPPPVDAPRNLNSPVAILRDMFASNPSMRVTQDSNGVVRMVEDGVPTDILNVRIRHLSFDLDPSAEAPNLAGELHGPNMAMMAILSSPEVVAFERAHKIEARAFRMPGNALDPTLAAATGKLDDVTVSQALDYVLRTFPGFWVYENCSFENGGREVRFWSY